MEILVSKNKDYYNFYKAVKRDNKVFLTELSKRYVSYPFNRTEIFPEEKVIGVVDFPLYSKNGKYYIFNDIEIIGKYDSNQHYYNIFRCK